VYFNHQVEGAQDLFEISIQQKTQIYENLLPFYWQVIDNANIQVHKLAMKMG
jgi:ribosomal 30S subunit maturation factor RimM